MTILAWVADSGHRDTFVKTLNAQRKGGEFCDVLLKISGRTLPTHACVLSACSPVFRELIYADRPNAPHLTITNAPQEIELVMPSVDGGPSVGQVDGLDVMVDLLDYIYTGYITLKNESVDMVVKLAEAFALDSLLSMVKSHLCERSKKTGRSGKGGAGSVLDANRKSPRLRGKVAAAAAAGTSPSPDKTSDAGSRRSQAKTGSSSSPRVSFDPEVRDMIRQAGASLSLSLPDEGGDDRGDAGEELEQRMDVTPGSAVRGLAGTRPARSYKCVSCDFSTGHCAQMLAHLREVDHTETECCLCGSVSLDRAAFLAHLTRHDDRRRPFFCRQCDYQCRSRANLAAHVAKHAVERPYKCDECGRGFKWTTSLKIHKLSHQNKMHLCDQCGYSTAYRNNLRVHARKHNGGMFPCAQCSYQANNRSQLKRHELTHAKLKPFVCEVCGQRFAQTGSLREHSKLHNLETSLLYCELCPYKTLRHYRLKSHVERTHGCWPPGVVGVGLMVDPGAAMLDPASFGLQK